MAFADSSSLALIGPTGPDAGATAPALAATGLVAGYSQGRRRTPIVIADALAAHGGQLTAVIGPNGGGKSTLLRTLIGALDPLEGTVSIEGRPLRQLDRRSLARRLAVVLTDRIDPGLLRVGDVISLGRHPHTDWRGALDPDDVAIARTSADRVGIAHLWDRRFDEVSDGQRQRVLVARALAQEPAVLVLDEPTAFLDLPGRVELTELLARLAHDEGLAVVVSSHDLDLVLGNADRTWIVHGGGVADGAPSDLIRDGHFAAAFPTIDIAIDATTGGIAVRAQPRP